MSRNGKKRQKEEKREKQPDDIARKTRAGVDANTRVIDTFSREIAVYVNLCTVVSPPDDA